VTKVYRDLEEMSSADLERLKKDTLAKAQRLADQIQRILNSRGPYPYSTQEELDLMRKLAEKHGCIYRGIKEGVLHMDYSGEYSYDILRDISINILQEMLSVELKPIKEYYIMKSIQVQPV